MRKDIFGAVATGTLVACLAAALPAASAIPSSIGYPGVAASRAVMPTAPVCPTHPRAGYATCLAVAVTRPDGTVRRSARPLDGFTPGDVQWAYDLTGLTSGGATVAVIGAYGYSHLEADLALYRETYDLPPCTVDNGCLTVIDQRGGSHYPRDDGAWDQAQALGVDAVSATCPDCTILVVQAKNSLQHNLEIAVDQAAEHGVSAISADYFKTVSKAHDDFDHPGIAITAPMAHDTFGGYPASDRHVVAVGGTSIVKDGSTRRGWTETAWSGTTSGCAPFHQQSWQRGADTTCSTRATSDVAAAADPDAGGLEVAYLGGFETIGGTSEAAPIIAAVFALSGRTNGYPARYLYRSPQHLYDITDGSTGSCGVPLCQARVGWDGPTGMGTPDGVRGF